MQVNLPERNEGESIEQHDARCGVVIADALTSIGIDPDSVYPVAIGDMVRNEETDTITMNVTMSCEHFDSRKD